MSRAMALFDTRNWGSTPAERQLEFPCDRHKPDFDEALYRAIDVQASPAVLFRWLCQLRAAPYSYDWIDNMGRRSPRQLVEGLERLETGQRVMRIFELVEFAAPHHMTLVMRRGKKVFGDVAVTYLVLPAGEGHSRLVAKLLVTYPEGRLGPFVRRLLPGGDAIMMRKQLRTLKKLAETAERAPD